jgi:hypothetical protein
MVDHVSPIPRYVLRSGHQALGLANIRNTAGPRTTAIYGFSDKPQYDVFMKQYSKPPTPYPLVRCYLQDQMEIGSETLRLVLIDATSATQATLYAVTFPALDNALLLGQSTIELSHQLLLDETGSIYQVLAFSPTSKVANI